MSVLYQDDALIPIFRRLLSELRYEQLSFPWLHAISTLLRACTNFACSYFMRARPMLRNLRPCKISHRVLCCSRAFQTVGAQARMAVQDRITPTEKERKLFSVLTNTLQHSGLPTVLRCAGGWVRDKLLGLESDDIDIAIDDMLGREFAEHVNKFLESQSLDTRKVCSNPSHSKLTLVEVASSLTPLTRAAPLKGSTKAQLSATQSPFTVRFCHYSLQKQLPFFWQLAEVHFGVALAGGGDNEQSRAVQTPGDSAHDSGRPGT